jgi:hypothetical protein
MMDQGMEENAEDMDPFLDDPEAPVSLQPGKKIKHNW